MWIFILLGLWVFILASYLGVMVFPAVAEDESPILPYTAGPEPLSDAVMVHRTDGSPIWIAPRSVIMVRGPLKAEGGNSVIVFAGGITQSVLETGDEVKALIDAKAGP